MITHEEAIQYIGNIYTKRNLQDFPIGNQPKQYVKMKIKDMPEFDVIVTSLSNQQAQEQRLKKVEELSELYEIKDELLEVYNVSYSLSERQRALDKIRTIREDIQQLEKELNL